MGVTEALKEKFPTSVLGGHSFRGDETIVIKREDIVRVCRFLRDEMDFNFLVDETAVDYLKYPEGAADATCRFEVVYHLYSLKTNARVRLKCPVPAEGAAIDSMVPLWTGANWLEREIYDMFGITFTGHPDLRRILMYDGFEGHPLRKDYPFRKRQPRVAYREVSDAPPPGGEVRTFTGKKNHNADH